MPSLFRFRTIVCVTCLTLPACVARLADRNSPEPNGGVTGEPANCSAIQILPHGAPAGEAAPKFVGRFLFSEDLPGGAKFDWSGNYVTIRVQNTSKVTAKLRIPVVPPAQDQMFTFVVDDLPPATRHLTVKKDASGNPTDEPEENYDIVGLDPSKVHEITIYKNTEAQKGAVEFKGFDLNGGTLLPPTRRPRRIEFIGDSIVCGYGNEGKNATCPFEIKLREAKNAAGRTIPVTLPLTENQYLAFTSITARALDADAVTVCWSGKGAYQNYKDRYVIDEKTGDFVREDGKLKLDEDSLQTMPKLWLERTVGSDDTTKWDFAQEKPEEKPQVVFISLGTNDFSRDSEPPPSDPTKLAGDNVPDDTMTKPEEREKFFQAYFDLVKNVRERRPDAHIFLAVPPMVTDQYPIDDARKYIRNTLLRIVAEQAKVGDRKVYQMDLVEQGFRYGLGCDYHPNLEVHRIMADQLTGAIRSKTCW
jgi:Carbohydrate esterase 2 N-terminal/GDSL-like Lipase/Acylhydrolase family